MNKKTLIKDYCKSLGLDCIGFMECKKFYELESYYIERKKRGLFNEFEEQDIEKRINPLFYMKEGKTIISIAFPYIYDLKFNNRIYFSKYTLGKDYHSVVENYLKKIIEYIEKLGGKAMHFVDSNALPERYIARKSGVGFIGKNNMLITKKYGSYVFLGEIIVDLELEADKPQENLCKECDICLKSCPTGAIKQNLKDSSLCLSYITQKKEIEDFWFEKFNGRIFGCDTCQRVCPFNKHVKMSQIEGFKPFDFMESLDIEDLANITNKDFKEKYRNTSCGWRGKNILQRNALINMFNMNIIEDFNEDNIKSPYIKNYYDRLFKFFKL